MRYLGTHATDKGTAYDAMTRIISRAVITMSKSVDKVVRYQLKDIVKLDYKLFTRVLVDSRKAGEKNIRNREMIVDQGRSANYNI